MDAPDRTRRQTVAPALDPGISELALRSIAVVVIVGAIVGRGLSTALRGWKVGLENTITFTDRTSSILAQLAIVAGSLFAMRLLVPILRTREIGIWFRLGITPVVPAMVTTVLAAAVGQLGPALTLALAAGTSVLALTGAVASFGPADTRAAGIVVGLAGTGAFVQLVARVLAVRASEAALASLFTTARWLATAGFVFDVASLVVALLWLSSRSRVRMAVIAFATCAIGALFAYFAFRGATTVDASGRVDELIARSLAELVRHPRALVPTVVLYAVEAAALALALYAAVARSRPGLAAVAVALAIAARSSTDMPIHGLALALAALLVPLASARSVELAARAQTSVDRAPSSTPHTQ